MARCATPDVGHYIVEHNDAAQDVKLAAVSEIVAQRLEEEIEARDDGDLGCLRVHTQLPHLDAVAPSCRMCRTGVSCSNWALNR
jgi:hypothetical protein